VYGPHEELQTLEPIASMASLKISESEVTRALESLDIKKACGHDNLGPLVYRNCATVLSPVLTIIYNKIITTCRWPQRWKHGRLLPVLKQGPNRSAAEINNYRLCIGSRILESLLATKIMTFFECANVIPDDQYAFRSKFSTELLVTSLCMNATSAVQDTGRYYLQEEDVASAYDSVAHEILLSRLSSSGLHSDTIKLLRSFLTNRSTQVVVGGFCGPKFSVPLGTPQGSPLACPMWIIMYAPVSLAIKETSTATKLFTWADDLNYASKDRNVLQTAGDACEKACVKSSLCLDVGKRESFEFAKRNTNPHATTKIVGCRIDQALTFTDHVDQQLQKANVMINHIKRNRRFFNRREATILYKAFVMPHLEYCSLPAELFGLPCQLSRLDSCQDRFARDFGLQLTSLRSRRLAKVYNFMSKAATKQLPADLCDLFQPEPPATTRQSSRLRENRHQQQIAIGCEASDCAIRRRLVLKVAWFNSLPLMFMGMSGNLNSIVMMFNEM
jgi:hypothetical protein